MTVRCSENSVNELALETNWWVDTTGRGMCRNINSEI